MKLQRYDFRDGWHGANERGLWCRASDVDALLARIRAAGDGLALVAADVSRLSGLPDSLPNLGALGAARMTLNEAIAAWQTVKGAE